VSAEVRIPRPTRAKLGYLAGIMDGEGYFSVSTRTRVFGLRVAMTDEAVVEWLHENFAGNVSRAGQTTAGNRVYTWTLQRQADLLYILPKLAPLLVLKREQAKAMLRLIRHLQRMPRWDTYPTRLISANGKGGVERLRRRQIRARWKEREIELRAAVRAAR
jgi:hypothetical protein